MKVIVDKRFDFVHELRRESNLTGMPLHSAPADQDVVELIEETFTRGLLAERLPAEPEVIEVRIEPTWIQEPITGALEITLAARANGSAGQYVRKFRLGRWFREAQRQTRCCREEGTLGLDDTAYSMLLALASARPLPFRLAPFQAPNVVTQSLEDCGVGALGAGKLLADRPVLVNRQFVADAVRRCREADTLETGGAVLGKIVRLDRPLPGTETRIVTILSASVDDRRHVGETLRFAFDPAALAEAAQIAELRGLGETVQTVYHTHGWKNSCGNCNQNAQCPLAEAMPSLQDYQLLESLFPSKATLMPIAGRKFGEAGRQPVLQIHAWRGGQMQPIAWQEYTD